MTDNGKKYFREDNYFKYGIAIVYEHVGETKLKSYEHFYPVQIHYILFYPTNLSKVNLSYFHNVLLLQQNLKRNLLF